MDISIIAKRLFSEYLYDPRHLKKPNHGNFHETEHGWSDVEPDAKTTKKETPSNIFVDKKEFSDYSKIQKARVILYHDKKLNSAIQLRKEMYKIHGLGWYQKLKGTELENWKKLNNEVVQSIRWARHTIGGDRWWDLPSVRKQRKENDELDPSVNINTPERKKLRDDIAAKLYGTGAEKKERKFFIVMGLPGSGKSSVVVNRIKEQHGVIEVDADLAKKYLPEYNGGAGAGVVHVESAHIAERQVLTRCMENGDNVVFPTVGKNISKMTNLIDKWKSAGYSISLSMVDVDPDSSIERGLARWINTGRFVDPEYIKGLGDYPNQTFNGVKHMVDDFDRWNNEVTPGASPVLTEKSKTAGITNSNVPIEDLDEERLSNYFDYLNQVKKYLKKTKLSAKEIDFYAHEYKKLQKR